MDWLYRSISSLVIVLIVKYTFNFKTKSTNEDDTIVYLPYNLKRIGLLFTGISYLIILIISFFVENSDDKVGVIVVFFGISLVGLCAVLFDYRWKIFVYDTKLVKRTFFKTYHIPYNQIEYNIDGHNIVIKWKYKTFYIFMGYPHVSTLFKSIQTYFSKNKIEYNYDYTTINGNYFPKNFGITFILLGIMSTILTLYVIFFEIVTRNEIIGMIIFGCLIGLMPILIGLYFVLIHKNFKVIVNKNDIEHYNIFGRLKVYEIKNLSMRYKQNGYIVYHKNKRKFYINYWIFNNSGYLQNLLYKKIR